MPLMEKRIGCADYDQDVPPLKRLRTEALLRQSPQTLSRTPPGSIWVEESQLPPEIEDLEAKEPSLKSDSVRAGGDMSHGAGVLGDDEFPDALPHPWDFKLLDPAHPPPPQLIHGLGEDNATASGSNGQGDSGGGAPHPPPLIDGLGEDNATASGSNARGDSGGGARKSGSLWSREAEHCDHRRGRKGSGDGPPNGPPGDDDPPLVQPPADPNIFNIQAGTEQAIDFMHDCINDNPPAMDDTCLQLAMMEALVHYIWFSVFKSGSRLVLHSMQLSTTNFPQAPNEHN